MSRLPAPINRSDRSSRQLAQAAGAQARTELAVFEHSLRMRYEAECERIDAEAVAEVIKCSLELEFENLDWGLEHAAGSRAKAEMVARRISMQSDLNNRRITRRFGS